MASAAAIKVRNGQISATLAKQARTRVQQFAQKHCTIAIPGRDALYRAAELAGDSSLKLSAGDALHLAVAIALSARGILCLDDGMCKSARSLSIEVVTV